jgi:hypothetical protein
MGMIFAAAAAYFVGANAGKQNFDNVVRSLDAIRRSDEFRELVEAVRIHVAGTLREVAGAIDTRSIDAAMENDIVERVMKLVGRD